MNIIRDWEYFWDNRELFKLGNIPTETPNPKTIGLAELAQSDLKSAIKVLVDIDCNALNILLDYTKNCLPIQQQIKLVLDNNGRIFIAGCGATGRLALILENLWRDEAPKELSNRIIGFIAGGDTALVKSIEGFEDHPHYAHMQIKELGFTSNDLMIGVTEGGETPFVLAAVEYAINHSSYKPWLLYCNPEESLSNIHRSYSLIKSKEVNNLCLFVGNMALTGSTRMQATTVQTLALGVSILSYIYPIYLIEEIKNLIKAIQQVSHQDLLEIIKDEATIYKNNDLITYETSRKLGLSVLTDTTERSPTFNTAPFENNQDKNPIPSLCFLSIKDIKSPKKAWDYILGHSPRTIEWVNSIKETGYTRLVGYDISSNAYQNRKELFPNNHHYLFKIIYSSENNYLSFKSQSNQIKIDVSSLSPLTLQVLLKCILNIHSTLVMALLKKFQSNIMTYVFPGNNKLIDRATRYTMHILKQEGIQYSYDEVAKALYLAGEKSTLNGSIVLDTVAKIKLKYDTSAQ
jgi:N-acetylmuramic acid 6-phosphate etherase